jgi:hypothetical protein
MRVLVPGHRYALANLVGEGETVLQFYQDPALHDGEGADGPSCQEVLRAVIDRVQELDRERHDVENVVIIHDLRHAIAGFEARALRRRVEKDGLAIELQPVATDGHLLLASGMSASGQDRGTGPEAKPASPVGEAETPRDSNPKGGDL